MRSLHWRIVGRGPWGRSVFLLAEVLKAMDQEGPVDALQSRTAVRVQRFSADHVDDTQ
jgi:hypothetical protein